MSFIGTIGFLAAVVTLFAYVPQAIKTIRTRKTRDLSLVTYILLACSSILWTTYGIIEGIPELWFTNSVIVILTVTILAIKIKNSS